MREETPFNPLDKLHLAESVACEMLRRPIEPLPPREAFLAAGIYAIYYTGDFPEYERIARQNQQGKFKWPIYVGKAIPAGARRGRITATPKQGRALHSRLVEHGETIAQAGNLALEDFACRYLAVDDIWIPLGESLLIQQFCPLWNIGLDGFGNHDPGAGRVGQQRSPWDVLHPGRKWAMRCAENRRSAREIRDQMRVILGELPDPA